MRTDYSIKLLDDESRFLNGRMIENILRYANVDKLKERIRKFQNMDIQKMSDKELEENIIKVLSIKTDEDVMIETILLIICWIGIYIQKIYGSLLVLENMGVNYGI